MAVVQISKIQVRRGRKNQTNLPQLSGGELGWAVDTQQLYIGNGSVGEGSPFVGNTEILTERSNIFGLLGAYTYADGAVQTGFDSNSPFSRSLQQKLDDIVSVRDFGAVGDFQNDVGTDDTAALQRAIDQIFLNPSNKTSERSHIKLIIPAGVYKITSTLYIPANANIVGDGMDNSVIYQSNENVPVFQTIATSSTPGTYLILDVMNSDNAPSNVNIVGITFQRRPSSSISFPIAYIDCLTKSTFEDCKFIGVWQNGDGEERSPVISGNNSAIQIRGRGSVTTEDVVFNNCEFRQVAHAVYSDYDTYRITFSKCTFKNLFRGLTLAKTSTSTPGQNFGPQDYTVVGSYFDKVDAEAWKVFTNSSSSGHTSSGNKFYDVGNNSAEQSQPTTPVLDFSVINCNSTNDYFQRNIDVNNLDLNKTGNSSTYTAYLPDVLGVDKISYPSKSVTLLAGTPVATPKILLKAPAWSSSKIVIEYVIRKSASDLYRSGTLTAIVHPNMATGIIKPTFTDDFVYYGQVDTVGNSVGGNVQFYAAVTSFSSVVYDPTTLVPSVQLTPTFVLRYSNPSGPGSNATITYSVSIISGFKDF